MKKSDKIFLIVLGTLGLGGVLVFGAILLFSKDSKPKTSISKDVSPNPSVVSPSGTMVVPEEKMDLSESTVTYRDGSFLPATATVDSKHSCALVVNNQSKTPLIIRLNPHSEKDDVGPHYPEIPPGEAILIDPRFRIPEIAFHNHRSPKEEFRVTLGAGCAL